MMFENIVQEDHWSWEIPSRHHACFSTKNCLTWMIDTPNMVGL
jgi:hypothetical protein